MFPNTEDKTVNWLCQYGNGIIVLVIIYEFIILNIFFDNFIIYINCFENEKIRKYCTY